MNLSAIDYRSTLGKLVRLPLRLLPREAQVPILQGTLRGQKWIVGASTHGCWIGSYEYDKQQLFADRVHSGHIVFDIGANVGFYTLLASTLVGETGRVFAFEPLPRNLNYLREHVRLNGVTNVEVFAVAVADRSGTAFFFEGTNPSDGHIAEQGSLTVQTICLDEWIQQGTVPAPDFMKIDVEGAELAVLLGARQMLQRTYPTLFLATHGAQVHRECCELLRDLGYQLTPIDSHQVATAYELLAFARATT